MKNKYPGFSKKQISEYADNVRKSIGLYGEIQIPDVECDVVREFGGNVKKDNLNKINEPPDVPFTLRQSTNLMKVTVDGPTNFTITIPYWTSPLRDRYNLSIGVGFYFLITNQGEKPSEFTYCTYLDTDDQTRIFYATNYFARCLLVPEHKLKELYEDPDCSLRMISTRFNVQSEIIDQRLRECNSIFQYDKDQVVRILQGSFVKIVSRYNDENDGKKMYLARRFSGYNIQVPETQITQLIGMEE